MNIGVLSQSGVIEGQIEVPKIIIAKGQSRYALYYAINAELANERIGTVATKGRSLVKGSGIKPWRQKGTGRARAGSRQSPLWRGGGVVFGPQPRSYRIDVPQKQRKVALCSALFQKAKQERMYIIDAIQLPEAKTKLLHQQLSVYIHALQRREKGYCRLLLVLNTNAEGANVVRRAGRNIPYLTIQDSSRLLLQSIFYSSYVLLYKGALEDINSSLEKILSRRLRAA